MGGSFQIGKLFGIPVRLHISWVLVFALVSWSLAAGYLPGRFPGWSVMAYWIVGLAGSVLLFVSVLAHEFSHSLVATSRGYKVQSITLFVLGGASLMESEAVRPSEEFFISVVGPVASLVLAGVFAGAYAIMGPTGNEYALALTGYLGIINLMLGLFNLIPGFPMDGGRVLRSIVWKATGSLHRATTVAAAVGSAIGVLFMGAGVFVAFTSNLLSGVWLIFIGWFIQSSAASARAQETIHSTLAGRKVRDVMTSQFPVVTPGTSLQELIDHYVATNFQRAFVVVHGDQFLGLVTASDIRKVDPGKRLWTPVTEIMVRPPEVATVSPDDSLEAAFHLLAQNGVHQLPVVEDGQPVGLITRESILNALEFTDLVATPASPPAERKEPANVR